MEIPMKENFQNRTKNKKAKFFWALAPFDPPQLLNLSNTI